MSLAELEGKEVLSGFGRERQRERERVQLVARWAQIEVPGQKLGVKSLQLWGQVQAWRHGCEGWQHFGRNEITGLWWGWWGLC